MIPAVEGSSPFVHPSYLTLTAAASMKYVKKRSHAEPLSVIGIHSVTALLEEHFDSIIKLWIASETKNDRVLKLADMAAAQSIALEQVKAKKLDTIGHGHQGILAWCRPPRLHNLQWLETRQDSIRYLLALDRITDCHNFGACLRSAEAAGIDAVLVPHRQSSALNAGVAKAASGALFRLPLVQLPLQQSLAALQQQEYQVIGLSEHADQSLYDLPALDNSKIVLVLGSEETGLSSSVISRCDQLVTIPCFGRNSSLNVSVAAGVALFQVRKNMTQSGNS